LVFSYFGISSAVPTPLPWGEWSKMGPPALRGALEGRAAATEEASY
jgi:hypothetical protein